MAHEFGHAVQARVGAPGASIATETQADCLAGSWTRWVADGQGRPHSGCGSRELDELLRGYLLLRDPVGTSTAAAVGARLLLRPRVGLPGGLRRAGAEACRDDFGPDRVFTQGEFTDRQGLRRQGNAAVRRSVGHRRAVPARRSGTRRSRDVFRRDLHRARRSRRFDGTAPDCAEDADRDLVYCPDDRAGRLRRADLARAGLRGHRRLRRRHGGGHPLRLAVRDQLGLSTDDEDAVRSAVCLTGWYAAKVYNRAAPASTDLTRGPRRERAVPARPTATTPTSSPTPT